MSYQADVYRFDLEKKSNLFEITINNVISWDYIKLSITKDELKGLSDFINNYLEKNNGTKVE